MGPVADAQTSTRCAEKHLRELRTCAGGRPLPLSGCTATRELEHLMMYVNIAARVTLALVFSVALVSKLRSRSDYRAFRQSIMDMRLFPRNVASPVAALTVAVEAGIVLLLTFPATVRLGFALAALLLFAMTSAIAIAIGRGHRSSCRCFGRSMTPLGRIHVVRDVLLLCVALLGGLSSLLQPVARSHPGGVAVAAGVGLVLTILVAASDDLIAVFGNSPRRAHDTTRSW